MARASISLPDEVWQKLVDTKPEHRAMSQYISELCSEAMKARESTPSVTAEIASLKESIILLTEKLSK